MPRPNLKKLSSSATKQECISKFFASKVKDKPKADQFAESVSNNTSKRLCEDQDVGKNKKQKSELIYHSQDTEPQASNSATVVKLPSSIVNKLNAFAYDDSQRGKSSQEIGQPVQSPSINAGSPQTACHAEANRNKKHFHGVDHENDNIQALTENSEKFRSTKLGNVENDQDVDMKSSTIGASDFGKGKSQGKLTPLEQQFTSIKEKYPDAILFVECGYKYRFFGEDAEIAAKELNIFAHPDHNFMTASIPVHRLFVHLRRLVSKGYKVGVVKQTETAALKAAGDNKSAPFTRQLSALYTKSTLIGEDVDPTSGETESEQEFLGGHLMCIYEDPVEGRPHYIGIVSVHPSTGDIIHDYFEDNSLREQLETRISHLQPVEILVPQTLTEKTEKVITHVTAISASDDDRIRVERHKDADFLYHNVIDGLSAISSNCCDKSDCDMSKTMMEVKKLSRHIQSCFHALWVYLGDFNLRKLLTFTSQLQQFAQAPHYMQLNGTTQRNLELFQNSVSNQKHHGTLVWLMDHCRTMPGRRLLRQWIARPLNSHKMIIKRLDAVTELINPSAAVLTKMAGILPTLPDLEKGLNAIFHKKCLPLHFYNICESLHRVHSLVSMYKAILTSEVTSDLLLHLLEELVLYLDKAEFWTSCINPQAAKDGDKTNIFTSLDEYPAIQQCKNDIAAVLDDIHTHRREIRLTLKSPALEYTTVMGTEFLIEVKNNMLNFVPKDWLKISSTKAVSRFHTQFIIDMYKRLNQHREQLVIEANKAWIMFLDKFEVVYPFFKKGARLIAQFDCLVSLAKVAGFEGYCRPTIVEDKRELSIKHGRHPVVEMLLSKHDQYVPNDTHMRMDEERAMVITGPNMGGKSSYIKQVALICTMAHIGSYVPADNATIPLLDAIHTRMGASDDLYHGRSTFMVELQEAAQILSTVTERSLVVLDELGRGTATHDGMAIAYATLRYLVTKVKCLTLFVTHYPLVAELENILPVNVACYHMAFLGSEEDDTESETVTFLYSLQRGIAARSFGLNVARLADIPVYIINSASRKSQELQDIIDKRLHLRSLCMQLQDANETNIKHVLENL